MNRTTTSLLVTAATAAILAGSVSAAYAAGVHEQATVADPATHAAATAHVRATAGAFSYELWAGPAGLTDVEHFGRIRDGAGSSGRPDIAADRVASMGYVAGGTSSVTGVTGAHLSGVAGDDVTSITVVPASGAPVPAQLDHGIWAAAWQGDPEAGGGRATVKFTTKDGAHHTASTDDIDWIAAEQRLADRA